MLAKSPNKFLAPLSGTWVIHLVLSDLNFQFDRLFYFVNFFSFCINSLFYFFLLLYLFLSFLSCIHFLLLLLSLTLVLTGFCSVFFFPLCEANFLHINHHLIQKLPRLKRRKNRKKKKQATTKTPGKSSSSDYLLTDKPLIKNNMVDRGEEGNRSPRRTLGDYAWCKLYWSL